MIRFRKDLVYLGVVFAVAAGAISVKSAVAQNDTSGQTPGRIGVVNRKHVFDAYELRKSEWDALQKEKDALQDEVDKLREAVNAGRTQLRENTDMPEEQRRALLDKVDADERAYEDKFTRAQGEIDGKSDKFFSKFLSSIDEGIRKVGAAENYKVILESDQLAGSPVLYFAPSIDLTDKVKTELNGK